MSINRRNIFIVVAGLSLGFASCRKFMNVNKDPNITQTATVQTLLPAAQLYVAYSLGSDFEVNGSFWAEYWTQNPNSSQFRSVEQYAPSQDYFVGPWSEMYTAAENFYQLTKLADSQKKKQYVAIAYVMKAYTFQLITDAFGDAPYKQALKGQVADSNILNPKFDSQRVIYNGILADIDSGLKLMNPADAILPGADDLMYGGDMTKWQKFAYTLKLRILLRMSGIDPVDAKAGIAALYATPGFSLIGPGDDAKIGFGYSAASKNPLYAEASSTTLAGTQNLVGSKTVIDSMNSNGDPRAYVFYELNSNNAVTGVPQGNYDAVLAAGSFSLPSIYVGGDANNAASGNAPVNFLTSWESYFLQAEVAARGWATGTMSDQSLFYAGIKANFDYYSTGLDAIYGAPATSTIDSDYLTGAINGAPGYWTVYPAAGTVQDKLRFIITQKWFAMCGNQGFEAWCEQRRTGYPDFLVVSKNTLIGQNLPKRFIYPTSESTRNANFPGLASITTKMWWDLY